MGARGVILLRGVLFLFMDTASKFSHSLHPSQHSLCLHSGHSKTHSRLCLMKIILFFVSAFRKFYIVVLGNGVAEALVYGDLISIKLNHSDDSVILHSG